MAAMYAVDSAREPARRDRRGRRHPPLAAGLPAVRLGRARGGGTVRLRRLHRPLLLGGPRLRRSAQPDGGARAGDDRLSPGSPTTAGCWPRPASGSRRAARRAGRPPGCGPSSWPPSPLAGRCGPPARRSPRACSRPSPGRSPGWPTTASRWSSRRTASVSMPSRSSAWRTWRRTSRDRCARHALDSVYEGPTSPRQRRAPPCAADGGRGQAGRRLAPDRLAGDQRDRPRAARDPRARAGGDAAARLPAELGRARAGHRALADARRGHVRHDAVRPGVDAGRRSSAPRTTRATSCRSSPASRWTARRSLQAVERLRALGVDGVMVIAPHVAAAARCGTCRPTCRWWRSRPGRRTGVPVVAVDQYAGARLATEHLLELGHRRCCHLAGPTDWLEAQHRIEGWRDALDAAGARCPTPLRGDWSPRSGYELGRELLELPRRDRGLRGQRPDGARAAARAARGGPRRARRHQRGRLRRHPRGGVLHAAADDGAPGLQRDGPARAAAAAAGDRERRALDEQDLAGAGADRAGKSAAPPR